MRLARACLLALNLVLCFGVMFHVSLYHVLSPLVVLYYVFSSVLVMCVAPLCCHISSLSRVCLPKHTPI